VITYLQRRDEVGSMIPRGAATSRKKTFRRNKTFLQLIKPGKEYQAKKYFEHIYSEYADILTTANIIEMTGLNKSTVLKLLKSGKIKSMTNSPKYIIPKKYLLEFLITPRFIESNTISETYQKIIGGLELWINAK
jgi:hypothetical protein